MRDIVSDWQWRAYDLFPCLRVWGSSYVSIYRVFSELLQICEEAHQEGNQEQLRKVYGFAEWCFHLYDFDISNAAAVAFYEHLADHPATYKGMPHWIEPELFQTIAHLFEWRLGEEEFARLKAYYEEVRAGARPEQSKLDSHAEMP